MKSQVRTGFSNHDPTPGGSSLSSSIPCHPSRHTWDTGSHSSDTVHYLLSTTHLTQWSQEWYTHLSRKISPTSRPPRFAGLYLQVEGIRSKTKSLSYWDLSFFPSMCFHDFFETQLSPLFLVAQVWFFSHPCWFHFLDVGESQSLYSWAAEQGGPEIRVYMKSTCEKIHLWAHRLIFFTWSYNSAHTHRHLHTRGQAFYVKMSTVRSLAVLCLQLDKILSMYFSEPRVVSICKSHSFHAKFISKCVS